MNKLLTRIPIAVGLIVLAVIMRLLPHPANFAPVAAVAIFGGAVLPRKLAIWVPLVAMAASDFVIGFYTIMPIVWACYAITAIAASYMLQKRNVTKVAAFTIAGSLFFFVVTNFAVWLWGDMYTLNFSGLVQCYTMALPFFRNTLAGDLFYTAALFGLYEVATHFVLMRVSVPDNKTTP
jgi:hypothetical protein